MKKQKPDVCPGCSKHCAADSVRCKYGRSYFAKRESAPPEDRRPAHLHSKKHSLKWEKHVSSQGAVWQLLWTSRAVKKALRGGEISESQLLAALTEPEQQQLCAALDKMNAQLKKFTRHVSNHPM